MICCRFQLASCQQDSFVVLSIHNEVFGKSSSLGSKFILCRLDFFHIEACQLPGGIENRSMRILLSYSAVDLFILSKFANTLICKPSSVLGGILYGQGCAVDARISYHYPSLQPLASSPPSPPNTHTHTQAPSC